jgi:hypothetical protein
MTESSEVPGPITLNLIKIPESSPKPEVQQSLDWYKEQLGRLEGMETKPESLEKGKWKVRKGVWGEVEAITSEHFDFEGLGVTTPRHSWNQGIYVQKGEPALDSDGNTERFSGGVIALVDPEGRVFFMLENEPKAKEEIVDGVKKIPALRVLQGSHKKLKDLDSPDGEKFDPKLFQVQRILGKTIRQMVQEVAVVDPKEGTMGDSSVVVGAYRVDAETAAKLGEVGRFLDRDSRAALFPKMNIHATSALAFVDHLLPQVQS